MTKRQTTTHSIFVYASFIHRNSAAPRMSKFHVAMQLVDDIRNLHGGRFLEPSATLTTKSHIVWCEAPLHRAIEKSSQVRGWRV
jgi:hypothetical protein